ncbi:flagellar assembly protein FliW [Paenibacillus koleovorans]|uniref:flagellar assembly protein FliW n=1 Tax=Paenibacillus koleovorans TaxID=121608 RepID=UPI0013E2893D|nr:flagellar assembly protein FliW [Paenibacillus koleovorans]
MVTVATRDFGQLELDEARIVEFPEGLPGFEGSQRFVLIQPNADTPLSVLQSVEQPDVAFVVTNPFFFYQEYEFQLSDKMVQELEVQSEQDVSVWVIVRLTEDLAEATMNLLAPIVVNEPKRLAKQMILHRSEYNTKHKLLSAEPAEAVAERE